jgi:hypothetical protein
MRFFLWLLLAWPTPALIAGALGWKGIWGNSNVVADYLVPMPVAGGAFHAMIFAAVTVLLTTQPRWPHAMQGMTRGILLGLSAAGVLILFDFERMHIAQNPIGLFLLTDSLIAQLFVGAFGGRWPASAKEWGLGLVAACVVPAVAAGAMHQMDPRTGKPFAYYGSRPGDVRGDDRHFVHSRLKVFGPEFRPAAEAYAQEWYPRYSLNTEDVAVHFFSSLPAAQSQDLKEATLTYCMFQDGTPSRWSAGKGDCFDHESVTERAQKLFDAQDPKLSLDERSRLARAKACEGVRVPAEDNTVARLCRKSKEPS